MKKFALAGAALIGVALGAYAFTHPAAKDGAADPHQAEPMVAVVLPETLSPQAARGKTAFDEVCASCHGENAAGKMGFGPPLIHEIYEPSHHGDPSFQAAAAIGVNAHHWKFGDMPPQTQVARAEVASIIAYIRELQRENGIE